MDDPKPWFRSHENVRIRKSCMMMKSQWRRTPRGPRTGCIRSKSMAARGDVLAHMAPIDVDLSAVPTLVDSPWRRAKTVVNGGRSASSRSPGPARDGGPRTSTASRAPCRPSRHTTNMNSSTDSCRDLLPWRHSYPDRLGLCKGIAPA